MENSESYYADGSLTDVLLSTANEVETSETAERESETSNQPLLSRAQPIEDAMKAMSETFGAQLATISSQMMTLTERMDNVEKGPRPIASTLAAPATVPSTSQTAAHTPLLAMV